MANIYIDNFETELTQPLSEMDYSMWIPPAAAARVAAAMGWSGSPPDTGGRYVRVPLYIDDGMQVEQVFAASVESDGSVYLMEPGYSATGIVNPDFLRRAGKNFAAGAKVRSAPPATLIGTGRELTRSGRDGMVYVAPGERAEIVAGGSSTINALIRCGSETDVHAGDSWPAELWVVNNYAAVSVQFKSFPYWEDVSVLVPGVAGVVTQVQIPASSAVARICIRRLPPRLRGSVAAPAVPWIVTVEHAG